jgi:hypothetical protein
MEINRDNYEAYLLDQMEGRLSAEVQRELSEFFTLNPDCYPESDDGEIWILQNEALHFPDKGALKKELPDASSRLTESNFDLFSIARMEGDLTLDQVREHEIMVTGHPTKQEAWEVWQQTRLGKEALRYPGKEELKRKEHRVARIPWISILASAAAIALFVIVMAIRQKPDVQLISEGNLQLPRIEEEQVFVPVTPPLQAGESMAGASQDTDNSPVDVVKDRDNSERDRSGVEEMTASPMASSAAEEQDIQLQVMPRRLRTALAANTISAPVKTGTYDRIRPLEIPGTPVHTNSFSISRLGELNLQEVVEEYADEKEFSLWTIANAGIKGINRITGADMALFAARDDEGDISGFQFKSKRLNISTPLEKEE